MSLAEDAGSSSDPKEGAPGGGFRVEVRGFGIPSFLDSERGNFINFLALYISSILKSLNFLGSGF